MSKSKLDSSKNVSKFHTSLQRRLLQGNIILTKLIFTYDKIPPLKPHMQASFQFNTEDANTAYCLSWTNSNVHLFPVCNFGQSCIPKVIIVSHFVWCPAAYRNAVHFLECVLNQNHCSDSIIVTFFSDNCLHHFGKSVPMSVLNFTVQFLCVLSSATKCSAGQCSLV